MSILHFSAENGSVITKNTESYPLVFTKSLFKVGRISDPRPGWICYAGGDQISYLGRVLNQGGFFDLGWTFQRRILRPLSLGWRRLVPIGWQDQAEEIWPILIALHFLD